MLVYPKCKILLESRLISHSKLTDKSFGAAFQHHHEQQYSTSSQVSMRIHRAAFGQVQYEKRYEMMHDLITQFLCKSFCDQYLKCSAYIKVNSHDPKGQMMLWFCSSTVCVYVCVCAYTSPPRVNCGVVLIVEVWMIQVAKGFKLQLSILEKVQLGEKGQPHKPKLEHTQIWKMQATLIIYFK